MPNKTTKQQSYIVKKIDYLDHETNSRKVQKLVSASITSYLISFATVIHPNISYETLSSLPLKEVLDVVLPLLAMISGSYTISAIVEHADSENLLDQLDAKFEQCEIAEREEQPKSMMIDHVVKRIKRFKRDNKHLIFQAIVGLFGVGAYLMSKILGYNLSNTILEFFLRGLAIMAGIITLDSVATINKNIARIDELQTSLELDEIMTLRRKRKMGDSDGR